jgi:hypothetical protein
VVGEVVAAALGYPAAGPPPLLMGCAVRDPVRLALAETSRSKWPAVIWYVRPGGAPLTALRRAEAFIGERAT